MTRLSVNLNKIALLRNARGRDYPNVVSYAEKFIQLGVQGITVHPRQDERHIKRTDVYDLTGLMEQYEDVEFNIEGYPSEDFLQLIESVKPDQCTLVPDDPNQLTSDHGWEVMRSRNLLESSLDRLSRAKVRSALFLDPDKKQIEASASLGFDRIELYTENYALAFAGGGFQASLETYRQSAQCAQSLGLGVNAGHDLGLANLSDFLSIKGILEVSIGHALTVESLDLGMATVVRRYLAICGQQPTTQG